MFREANVRVRKWCLAGAFTLTSKTYAALASPLAFVALTCRLLPVLQPLDFPVLTMMAV
jgi:hypothetical protein